MNYVLIVRAGVCGLAVLGAAMPGCKEKPTGHHHHVATEPAATAPATAPTTRHTGHHRAATSTAPTTVPATTPAGER